MSAWLIIVLIVVLAFGAIVLRGAPYVPTKRKLLERAFDKLYPLTKDDVLVDIGSGDGIVLRAAADRGARAIGYELNPILVVISRLLSRDPRISIRLADFWHVALPPETTIVYTFGESRDIKRMFEKAAQAALVHKKELYFMSFGFPVPGEKEEKYDGSFYLYRIKPLQRRRA